MDNNISNSFGITKIRESFDLEIIQKLQDSFALAHDIAVVLETVSGERITEPSNSVLIREKTESDGSIAWDRKICISYNVTGSVNVSVIKGKNCDESRFNNICTFLELFAGHLVSMAVRTADQRREINRRIEIERKLTQRNEHDMLTNLYNRYFYENKLTEVILNDISPVSIAVIDANLLKLSNDLFGHVEGDCLLQLISAALVEEKRDDYYCCRCGGDEFYVIMVGADNTEAENYLKRVIERTKNDYCTRIPPSFAYGIATKHEDDKLVDVIKQAEDAMYLRKIDMKCDGRILGILRQCLIDTGHFNVEDALKGCNLAFDFEAYIDMPSEDRDTTFKLLELYPLGMLCIPADVLRVAGGPVADKLAHKYDYVSTEYRIAMMFEETAPVAHRIMQWNEKWDGTGRPNRLSGAEICLPIRLLRITTQYMKYTSGPPFGYELPQETALEKMREEAGRTFDPELFEKFCDFIRDYRMHADTYTGISGASDIYGGKP